MVALLLADSQHSVEVRLQMEVLLLVVVIPSVEALHPIVILSKIKVLLSAQNRLLVVAIPLVEVLHQIRVLQQMRILLL